MSSREIAESIRRIEGDLYYSSDNIKIRLTRIEEKLEHVATRDDLGVLRTDMERMRTDMLAHSNTLFRWSIGIFVTGFGAILTVMKLT
ncbi:MAG: hypothetical protein OXH56_03045 [Gemmatimonadetes bacterium]|nr:hypothetical protein [Gemmatimonadota bacterium]